MKLVGLLLRMSFTPYVIAQKLEVCGRSYCREGGHENFFVGDTTTWLNYNLQDTRDYAPNVKWASLFAITCWWLWKW